MSGCSSGSPRKRKHSDTDDTASDAADDEAECEVCHARPRKYCCPRCAILTCSLECCLQHKRERGCSGKRDRVGYCSIAEFSDARVRSDYAFLEDAKLSADRAPPPPQRGGAPRRRRAGRRGAPDRRGDAPAPDCGGAAAGAEAAGAGPRRRARPPRRGSPRTRASAASRSSRCRRA